jgi:hypothetical protein
LLSLLLLGAPAWAQGEPPAPAEPKGKDAEAAPADDEGEEDEETGPRWLVVRGGTFHTGTGAVLRDAALLARDGKIVGLGRDVVAPEDAEVLDVAGMHVYPGLVAFDSSGILGSPPQDATNVFGLELTLGLATGITTAGSGGAVAKLTYGTLEGHLLAENVLVKLEVGEASSRRSLRADLERVRTYLRERQAFVLAKQGGDEEAEEPNRKWIRGKYAAYEGLLQGTQRARVEANSAEELTWISKLAQQYGFQGVVSGCVEAWTVAGQLGRSGLTAVVVPRARSSRNPHLNRDSGWSIENAARLHEHGVPLVIMSRSRGIGTWGLAGQDLFTLPLEAAFAVRGGLSEEAALEALTLGPARALGVDARVGSLEVGKDCDLIVTQGDLLHYETLVEWSVVDGRIAYDRDEDSLLRHVRPRDLGGEGLQVPQLWPRPLGLPEPEMPERERR